MAKRQRPEGGRIDPPPPRPMPRRNVDPLNVLTMGGVVILLMISFSNWRMIDRIQDNLDTKLGEIDKRIAAVSDKVGKAAPAQAARRGPDPNKAYTVKTTGSPAKGPADAPIVIAEFSDFQ